MQSRKFVPAKATDKSARPVLHDDDSDEDVPADLASDLDRKFVTSLARGLDLLRAYQRAAGPLGNAELAALTGIPKPTVSRLTFTLTQLGNLKLDRNSGRYELSPAVLGLGYPVLANLKIRHLAYDAMQQIAAEGGLSVAMAAISRHNLIYVHTCAPSHVPTRRLDVGSRVSLVHTAIGRAYLAGVSEDERAMHFRYFKERLPDQWPDLRDRVDRAIDEVKTRGFCLFDREWNQDVRAVAAPIISRDGSIVLSANCASPAFQTSVERMVEDIGPRLAHMTQELARVA